MIHAWGPDTIGVTTVLGHATEADVEAGRSTAFLRAGNGHADHFASIGMQVVEDQSPSELSRERYREAEQWYDWLFVLCTN